MNRDYNQLSKGYRSSSQYGNGKGKIFVISFDNIMNKYR